MTTNVPAITFGARGFIAPSEADILTGIIADIDAAFGGGVNPALETPQGQLASSEAAIVGNANDTFVLLTNLVDPAYSYGRMQDAIGRIYFLDRIPSAPTVVQATCTGLTGVVIPVGALAIAADGNIYTCTEAGTIPIGGSVTLAFACNTVGPIACPADTLNKIYQAIPGWDSVNNATDGVLGINTEGRAAYEERRAATVAANAVNTVSAILGVVLKVAGVLDAYVDENDTNAPLTKGGVTLIANSLYVAVVGGAADDVAAAILSRKAPGCSYNGNTTVVVEITAGYNPPYPSYNVQFETPTSLSIMFRVRITNNAQVPANAVTLIQNAIILAFSGADGGPRARIGSVIYASRYYTPVALLGSWAQIVAIQVGSINNPEAQFTATIAGINMTVSAVASGVLAAGQTIADVDADVVTGTTIISQSSGPTGGTGVYVVSNTQTLAAPTTIYSALATRDSITTRIDQSPTISANNIEVVLV